MYLLFRKLTLTACFSANLTHFRARHFYTKITQITLNMSIMQFNFIQIAHMNIFAQIY